jgi:hypothetical protein
MFPSLAGVTAAEAARQEWRFLLSARSGTGRGRTGRADIPTLLKGSAWTCAMPEFAGNGRARSAQRIVSKPDREVSALGSLRR